MAHRMVKLSKDWVTGSQVASAFLSFFFFFMEEEKKRE